MGVGWRLRDDVSGVSLGLKVNVTFVHLRDIHPTFSKDSKGLSDGLAEHLLSRSNLLGVKAAGLGSFGVGLPGRAGLRDLGDSAAHRVGGFEQSGGGDGGFDVVHGLVLVGTPRP